jgi:hypothetical protein
MTSRIQGVTVRPTRLTPADAELDVEVRYTFPKPTTEFHGRLMGPTCLYSTTIEVAYRVRFRPQQPGQPPAVQGRVLIPDPSWWDPHSPFLYHGPVELWEEGQKVEEVSVRCGLRHLLVTPGGLRWNGTLLPLRGVRRADCTEPEMRQLHGEGVNLLLVPYTDAIGPLWDIADRVGMLLLAELPGSDMGLMKWAAMQPVPHPSHLGFVVQPEGATPVQGAVYSLSRMIAGYGHQAGCVVGVFLNNPPGPAPEGARFVVCDSDLLPHLSDVSLPRLVVGGDPAQFGDDEPILGTIAS